MYKSFINKKYFQLIFILLFAAYSTALSQNSSLAFKPVENHPVEKRDSALYQQEKIPLSLLPYNNYKTYNFDPLETELNYGMLYGVGAAALGIGVAVHIYQRNAWWKDQRTSFHFANDWEYSLGIDKIGHFFGAAFLAHAMSSGLEAANMQSEDAAIWGSAGALAFQLYVEIEDGFGPYWGFSPGDMGADILGAGFTLSQYYFPFMKNFLVKFSYYPSEKMQKGLHPGNAIDDYEGQKYWLSMRVKNFLPDDISDYWPSFLNIAAGMGVRNITGSGGGQREFYIAFDFDTESIPLYGKVWQFIKNTFNYIHLPMPGVRITPDAAFFGLVY